MKKIIDKKTYNTDTAQLVAEEWNGLGCDDFRYLLEELYRTKKGTFFLYGSGGPMTKYSESSGRSTWGINTIIPMSDNEAYDWLEENGHDEAIENYFSDIIEEA